ncbi:MAG: hypothetical protein ACTSW1_09605 [Candidatus Hodarchaeales archaeon]
MWLVPLCQGVESSVHLEFAKDYPIVSEEINLEQEIQLEALQSYGFPVGTLVTIGFSGSIESNLEFSETMILTTTVSDDYVSAGQNVDVILEPRNAISLIKIHGDISGSINWDAFGTQNSIPISLKEFDVSHALSENIGEKSTVVMDEETLYSGTIPFLGLQIEIFARPVLEYTPRLWGTMNVDGPAIVQEGLSWDEGKLVADVRFTETSPVSIELTTPYLVLDQFKACMNVYMIASTVTFGPTKVDLIELGSYELTEEDVMLIHMEPDLYELIQIMQEARYPDSELYLELSDDVNLLEARINDALSRISEVESENNHISRIVERDLYPLINELVNIKKEVNQIGNDLSVLDSDVISLNYDIIAYSADANGKFLDLNDLVSTLYTHDWYLGFGIVVALVLVVIVIRELRRHNVFLIY